MPIYTWITDPPIVEVPLDQVFNYVTRFQSSVQPVKEAPGDYGVFSAAKAGDSIDISDGFKNSFDSEFKRRLVRRTKRAVYAYMLDGLPVGLIDISVRSDDLYIEHVVGHAGTENAGDVLIEHVLQFSPVSPPVVELFAATEAAFKAYKKLGFVAQTQGATSGGMILDLKTEAAKGLWTPRGGNRYKLTSGLALNYLTNA
jgi:hypothetical protein